MIVSCSPGSNSTLNCLGCFSEPLVTGYPLLKKRYMPQDRQNRENKTTAVFVTQVWVWECLFLFKRVEAVCLLMIALSKGSQCKMLNHRANTVAA